MAKAPKSRNHRKGLPRDWRKKLRRSRRTSWEVKYPRKGWIRVPPCEAVEAGFYILKYPVRLGSGDKLSNLPLLRGIQL